MPAIMADHDIEGQVRAWLRLLTSPAWYEVWHGLAMRVESFASLRLPENTPDTALWQFCQTQQIILITGNRNKAGTDAREAVIEQNNTPTSLPVLTPRVLSSRAYAERVVTRLLEVLLDVEQYRGTGRLYLP